MHNDVGLRDFGYDLNKIPYCYLNYLKDFLENNIISYSFDQGRIGKENVMKLLKTNYEEMLKEADKMIAFVGTSEPKQEVYQYLQSRKIACFCKTERAGNTKNSIGKNRQIIFLTHLFYSFISEL